MLVSKTVSIEVQRAIWNICQELGNAYSLDDIIGYTERWRQKLIRIENDRMPLDMTGYAVALLDCDLICKCPRLDALLERRTVLHELAHLILNHIPPHPKGAETLSYATFVQQRDRHIQAEHCLYRQRVHGVIERIPREQDAEVLAILLNKGIRKYEAQTPLLAQMLHG
ncbi:MAG TPA: hypothetical protein VFS21_30055 [Roseiflexaceae bacterium]|nr:hypothetical protein [Roseiflexaceae bacterium]